MKPGDSPHMANITWNASSKTYTCEYLIPDRTVRGYWPDDGTYYVRVVGRKGTTEKEKLLTLTVRGHVLDRTIIRTYRW